MYKICIKLSLLGVFLSLINTAEAAQIQNLSPNPQTIEIETNGTFEPVTIAAGDMFSRVGQIKVKWKDHVVSINADMEYVIWNDKDFSPQRAIGRKGS